MSFHTSTVAAFKLPNVENYTFHIKFVSYKLLIYIGKKNASMVLYEPIQYNKKLSDNKIHDEL